MVIVDRLKSVRGSQITIVQYGNGEVSFIVEPVDNQSAVHFEMRDCDVDRFCESLQEAKQKRSDEPSSLSN